MNKTLLVAAACVAAAIVAGCASTPSAQDLDKLTLDLMKASFRDEGIAKFYFSHLNYAGRWPASSGRRAAST